MLVSSASTARRDDLTTTPVEALPSVSADCPLARAAARALGLDEDCYEVLLLEVLRREAPKRHPDGEGLLRDFARDRALLDRISALGPAAHEVYERYYRRGVERCAPLIQSGQWWRAFLIERVAFRRIEKRYPESLEEGSTQRV